MSNFVTSLHDLTDKLSGLHDDNVVFDMPNMLIGYWSKCFGINEEDIIINGNYEVILIHTSRRMWKEVSDDDVKVFRSWVNELIKVYG